MELKNNYLSVDPGYNGVKIATGRGHAYYCPSNVQLLKSEQDLKRLAGRGNSKEHVTYKDGTSVYSMGYLASILEIDDDEQAIGKEPLYRAEKERFMCSKFDILCKAAIYCALKKEEREDGKSYTSKDNTVVIEGLSIAVPIDFVDAVAEDIIKRFKGTHVFDISIGELNVYERVTLIIKHVAVGEQAILSLIGYGADDNGYMEKLDMYKDFPLLGLDLGYDTAGIVEFKEEMFHTKDDSMSNFDFTMEKVNAEAARRVSSKTGRECTHRTIENAIIAHNAGNDNKLIWYAKEESGLEEDTVNLLEERNRAVTSVVNGLYHFLDSRFRLNRYEKIVISGGSGSCFFELLSKKIRSNYKNFKEDSSIVLAKCEFNGASFSELYAVAVGGLKSLAIFEHEEKLAEENKD